MLDLQHDAEFVDMRMGHEEVRQGLQQACLLKLESVTNLHPPPEVELRAMTPACYLINAAIMHVAWQASTEE